MPEYVYALHDFAPEHEDEIAFSAGDRIEVIEKDDMYGDGWWQGRNLFGKVGLFPQSYATSDPSVLQAQSAPQPDAQDTATATDDVAAAPLQTLNEESETASVISEGKKAETNENVVMRATMTDVQEAIEQLGRNDRDGGASFSFASTHDTDRETETDRETDSEAWHKGARSNLAEKARQQQELLQQEQAAYANELRAAAPNMDSQDSEPPIDFEVSDESEDEDGEHVAKHPASDTPFGSRDHAYIPEEEEDDEELSKRQVNGKPGSPKPVVGLAEQQSAIDLIVQGLDVQDPPTARQTIFPIESDADAELPQDKVSATTKPHPDSIASTIQAQSASRLGLPPLLTPTSPSNFAAQQRQGEESTANIGPFKVTLEPEMKRVGSPQGLPSPPRSQDGTVSSQSKFQSAPPSEWSVDDVVEWAKSKGFDNSVCDKFIEHEISGDVLLELDANVLKTELEIHAFGKRTRIMKEITELRRPPSVQSSVLPAHSRTISQSISLPGSAHHSMISPMTAVRNHESPPNTGGMPASPGLGAMGRDSDPNSSFRASETDLGDSTAVSSSMVGLGFGATASATTGSTIGSAERLDTQKGKGRPAYLNLSPSDQSIGLKPKTSTKFSPKSILDEDRAALSDTESTVALDNRSRRRRLFGRSTGSANSDPKEPSGRRSNETRRDATTPVSASMSLPGSPSTKRGSTEDSTVKPRQRRKRSADASRPADRLSLFGANISNMTIGRSRKPAPRVPSSYAHDDVATTEKHTRGFSRLYLGTSGRKVSGKTQTGGEDHGSEDNDSTALPSPTVLRKRTSSVADVPTVPGIAGGFKTGQSVLEQIGAPDHNGWMHKKGEHYNTWKLRYFVLKGPHLYYLRSNSKAETKIKGYINIIGYKVVVDENINPGKYGFRIIHDSERTHYFCSDESIIIREWMKALMKATIGRDYSKPVISSCNIPTIPLAVAQTMNPAPRPPSPTQREATQKALRRENPNQLSSRDARILMGLPSTSNANGNANGAAVEEPSSGRTDNSFFTLDTLPEASENDPTPMVSRANSSDPTAAGKMSPSVPPPSRPSRETRRMNVPQGDVQNAPADLILWANEHLPEHLRITEAGGQIYSGLALYRLAEAIKGRPTEPAVPDSAFPSGPNDDRLDGLFKLFDFFLDNDIRMGNVSINDVRQGRPDKVVHLLRSLKAWDDKRHQVARSIGRSGIHAGPFMSLESPSVQAW